MTICIQYITYGLVLQIESTSLMIVYITVFASLNTLVTASALIILHRWRRTLYVYNRLHILCEKYGIFILLIDSNINKQQCAINSHVLTLCSSCALRSDILVVRIWSVTGYTLI